MIELMENILNNQPIINIGCLGSVSDGKSTLVEKLTGIKTQRHSNEKNRNITIKQGYANMKIWEKDNEYDTLNNEGKLVNHISFVDCPGHQELIKVMLSSISLMDGAIVVIAVDQPLNNKPQLIQHLAAAKLGNLKRIIICMNKIDLVKKDILYKRKEELDLLLKEYNIEPFAIIPTCFNKKIGIKYLLNAIMKLFNPNNYIDRLNKDPIFRISRTFDINKPGTSWENILGGVVGGSLIVGQFKINDEIEIVPGQIIKNKNGNIYYQPIKTTILSIKTDTTYLTEIVPGGLIAIGTDMDPYYCKNDFLSGNIIGLVNKTPKVFNNITLDFKLITIFGHVWEPNINDLLVLQIGTKTVDVKLINKNNFELTKPVCILDNEHIIICKEIDKILRIVGEGYLLYENNMALTIQL